MEMIIGGAYQGKLSYAKKLYPKISWLDGGACTKEELLLAEGVYDFQQFIRRQMEAGALDEGFARELLLENPEIVIVSCEVGGGVVPIDTFDREYREKVGRICTKLAEGSRRVHRVICGIGTVIKEDTCCGLH